MPVLWTTKLHNFVSIIVKKSNITMHPEPKPTWGFRLSASGPQTFLELEISNLCYFTKIKNSNTLFEKSSRFSLARKKAQRQEFCWAMTQAVHTYRLGFIKMNAIKLNCLRPSCRQFCASSDKFSYKSAVSLENVYPKSSFSLTAPTEVCVSSFRVWLVGKS